MLSDCYPNSKLFMLHFLSNKKKHWKLWIFGNNPNIHTHSVTKHSNLAPHSGRKISKLYTQLYGINRPKFFQGTYLDSRPRKTFLHPSAGDTRFLMVVLNAKQKQSNLRASPKLYMLPNRAAAAGSAFSYLIIYERFEFEFCTEPKNFCASRLFHLPCRGILSMTRVERVEASKEKHNLTLCVLSVSLLLLLPSSSDPVADVWPFRCLEEQRGINFCVRENANLFGRNLWIVKMGNQASLEDFLARGNGVWICFFPLKNFVFGG